MKSGSYIAGKEMFGLRIKYTVIVMFLLRLLSVNVLLELTMFMLSAVATLSSMQVRHCL